MERRNSVELFATDGYHHRAHSKTRLMVHVVFVTKYRKPILNGSIRADVKQLLFESARKHHWYIEKMETDKDHVHILLRYSPTDSISHIVRLLKQESTYYIWRMQAGFLKDCYWEEHTLWSDGYFAASVGDASAETIRKYIENQG